jgi:hypothetical protein
MEDLRDKMRMVLMKFLLKTEREFGIHVLFNSLETVASNDKIICK